MSKQNMIAAFMGAALISGAWASLGAFSSGEHHGRDVHFGAEGTPVSWTVVKSPTTESGATIKAASTIEFHKNYVVIKSKDGGGAVVPVERMTSFGWGR